METVKYGKVEIEKRLYTFLKKKRVLGRFVKNAKADSNYIRYVRSIIQGFFWMESPEGHNFWHELNNEFEN